MEPLDVEMNDGRKGWKWPDDEQPQILFKSCLYVILQKYLPTVAFKQRHDNLEQGETEVDEQLGSCLEFTGEK